MAKQQKETIKIPDYYDREERLAIAAEIIDRIIVRTQSENKDKDGKKFPGYSDSYSKSLDFKILGKSKSKVDLTFSGDMLQSLKLLSERKGQITIGYDAGDPINGKVEGNRIGSYGKEPNEKRARDFLGISDKDRDKILENYPIGRKNFEERKARVDEVMTADIVSQEILSKIKIKND